MLESILQLGNKLRRWVFSVQPYLLMIFLILFVGCVIFSTVYYSKDFLPYPASETGTDVLPLFNTTTVFTGIAFFLTQILLFYFAFRFRKKEKTKARHIKNSLKLEMTWTLIPLLVFLFLFIWGQTVWSKMMGKPEGDVVKLEVMGAQFSWRVRYPGKDGKLGNYEFRYISNENPMGLDVTDSASRDDFIPVQMHVPKGRPISLVLRSRDVIHSFFIPHLRVKMDAVPGMATRLHFTATTTTEEMRQKLNNPDFNYEVACAELCGRLHFAMKLILVVDEPEEYEKWAAAQPAWITSQDEKNSEIYELQTQRSVN